MSDNLKRLVMHNASDASLTFKQIESELATWARSAKGLTCLYPEIDEDNYNKLGKDQRPRVCSHNLVIRNLQTALGLPVPENVRKKELNFVGDGRHLPIHIHPYVMVGGETKCGRHTFPQVVRDQITRQLQAFNHRYGKYAVNADLVDTPDSSSVADVMTSFYTSNLFVALCEMAEGGAVVSLYEYRAIGVVYQEKKEPVKKKRGRGKKKDRVNAKTRRTESSKGKCLASNDMDNAGEGNESSDIDNGVRNEKRPRKFSFCYVIASIASLLTSVVAWEHRNVGNGLVISSDHMYNPLKGEEQVYLFNAGLNDAKHTFHNVVTALQLGRNKALNKLVGTVWRHHHIWLRKNVGEIVRIFKDRGKVNILNDLCVPEGTFKAEDLKHRRPLRVSKRGESTMQIDDVGELHLAAPLSSSGHPPPGIFEKQPNEPHRIMWLSDGDLTMLTGLGEGLCGADVVGKEVSTTVPHVDGCRFHKMKNMRAAFNRAKKEVTISRNKDPRKWDKDYKLGYLLGHNLSLDQLFGTLLDIVGMHDAEGVALTAWDLTIKKCKLMGMIHFAKQFNENYNPVNGKTGVWGRFNMVRIGGGNDHRTSSDAPTGIVKKTFATVVAKALCVVKGTPSSTNSLEARVNKTIKRHLAKPLGFAPLVNQLPRVLTTAQRSLSELGYSFVTDQTGRWTTSQKPRESGRSKATLTSRDFRKHFILGVDRYELSPRNDIFFWSEKIKGVNGQCYVAASAHTRLFFDDMMEYEAGRYAGDLPRKKLLREKLYEPWKDFVKDPMRHVLDLDIAAKDFDEERAKRHMLDRNAFSSNGKKWDPKDEGHRFRLTARDFVFNAWAFKVLCPNPSHVPDNEAPRFIIEHWRSDVDQPVDYAYFTALFCPQFANYGFSPDVVQAMLTSQQNKHELPKHMLSFEKSAHGRTAQTAKDKFGIPKDLWSPLKETKGYRRQRWKSQGKRRNRKTEKDSHSQT